jgi:hypothetical protein
VRHQAGDVVASFGLDLLQVGLFFRVRGAAEREVLPDQDPELVGGVVERVLLVEADAVDAEQVDVGVLRLLETPAVARGVDAAREAVVRRPVGAAGEDRAAVDHDRERRADLVR